MSRIKGVIAALALTATALGATSTSASAARFHFYFGTPSPHFDQFGPPAPSCWQWSPFYQKWIWACRINPPRYSFPNDFDRDDHRHNRDYDRNFRYRYR